MENNYKFTGTGLTTVEKRWGVKRFKEYQENYHIDSLSDLQLLEELVFREAIQERYKSKIEKLENATKKNENGEIVPKHILYALDENLKNIIEVKTRLGLFNQNQEQNEGFKALQTLQKKFEIWMEENQGSRELKCPHCKEMILLKIRIDKWDAIKHPFFKDKLLSNEHLLKLYKENKITKEDVAKVLNCSPDYIDWIISKIKPSN